MCGLCVRVTALPAPCVTSAGRGSQESAWGTVFLGCSSCAGSFFLSGCAPQFLKRVEQAAGGLWTVPSVCLSGFQVSCPSDRSAVLSPTYMGSVRADTT